MADVPGDGGFGGTIFASIELSTADVERGAQAAAAAIDGAAAATKRLDGVIVDANGRMRDAHGRFVGMGDAARQATADVNAQAAAVQNLGQKASGAAAAFDDYARSSRAAAAARSQFYDQMGNGTTSFDVTPGPHMPGGRRRLEGPDRAAAMTRAGFGVANLAQDIIQGGPASGINNILFMAGDSKMRALAGEAVEAAGGLRAVGAAFGTVSIAAGAAFLLINEGLKSANLGWGDFTTVVANTGPFQAAATALGAVKAAADFTGITTIVGAAWDVAKNVVGTVADLTIGWGSATEAARKHRDEIAEGVKKANEYVDALKTVNNLRSEEQDEAARRGKLVGRAIANLGGEGGVDSVIDKAAVLASKGAADELVEVPKVNAKGEQDGWEKITRREAARRRIVTDIGAASKGDEKALGRLTPLFQKSGFDLRELDAAAQGTDRSKEIEDDQKENERRTEATAGRREKAAEDKVKATNKDSSLLTGEGAKYERDTVKELEGQVRDQIKEAKDADARDKAEFQRRQTGERKLMPAAARQRLEKEDNRMRAEGVDPVAGRMEAAGIFPRIAPGDASGLSAVDPKLLELLRDIKGNTGKTVDGLDGLEELGGFFH